MLLVLSQCVDVFHTTGIYQFMTSMLEVLRFDFRSVDLSPLETVARRHMYINHVAAAVTTSPLLYKAVKLVLVAHTIMVGCVSDFCVYCTDCVRLQLFFDDSQPSGYMIGLSVCYRLFIACMSFL